MKRLIIFLIRRKLGLKKNQLFQFVNQSNPYSVYYFSDTEVMKLSNGKTTSSNVSLNWLLDDKCEIVKEI